MLENDAEIRRLIHVASLYYEKEMTQSEIAKEMNVSRPLVSKMLSRARGYGDCNHHHQIAAGEQ